MAELGDVIDAVERDDTLSCLILQVRTQCVCVCVCVCVILDTEIHAIGSRWHILFRFVHLTIVQHRKTWLNLYLQVLI
jgi:hypothetical protein